MTTPSPQVDNEKCATKAAAPLRQEQPKDALNTQTDRPAPPPRRVRIGRFDDIL
jgi:hypothetical protein